MNVSGWSGSGVCTQSTEQLATDIAVAGAAACQLSVVSCQLSVYCLLLKLLLLIRECIAWRRTSTIAMACRMMYPEWQNLFLPSAAGQVGAGRAVGCNCEHLPGNKMTIIEKIITRVWWPAKPCHGDAQAPLQWLAKWCIHNGKICFCHPQPARC